MGIQLSKVVSTRARPVVSGSMTRSRMQRDITSFACSSSELNDNPLPRDQPKSHFSHVSAGVVSSKSRSHSKTVASAISLPPLPSFPSSSLSSSKEWSAVVGVSHKSLDDIPGSSLDLPPASQVLTILNQCLSLLRCDVVMYVCLCR